MHPRKCVDKAIAFNFRKNLKIAAGIRLNIGKKGVSSLSVGTKGMSVNLKRKQIKTTLGIPKTGLSYTSQMKLASKMQQNLKYLKQRPPALPLTQKFTIKRIGFWLGLGILLMPYLFSWFTLVKKYSNLARFISFSWLLIFILLVK